MRDLYWYTIQVSVGFFLIGIISSSLKNVHNTFSLSGDVPRTGEVFLRALS